MGSASELEYHLLLAKDLKLKPKDHAELSQRAAELKRMLTALLPKLKADRCFAESSRPQDFKYIWLYLAILKFIG